MSFLGDLLDFELFNLEEVWKTIKDDPERLFLGALTPAGTELWSGILDKDWEPSVNWLGRPSEETFRKAQESGIDIGPATGVHDIAESVAASYAAGWGFDQLGATGDILETGTNFAGSGGGQQAGPTELFRNPKEDKPKPPELGKGKFSEDIEALTSSIIKAAAGQPAQFSISAERDAKRAIEAMLGAAQLENMNGISNG